MTKAREERLIPEVKPVADGPVTAESAKAPEFLWKVIQRYDTYVGSTNAKAAMLGTFNTFVVGAVVLKWHEVVALYGAHPKIGVGAGAVVLIAALASLYSLWRVFKVVHPFLDSSKKPGQYHSDIFFGHVAEHGCAEDYLRHVAKADEATTTHDLGAQAHALACGLRQKFNDMRLAVGAILYVQLPALGVLLMIKFVTLVMDLTTKGVQP